MPRSRDRCPRDDRRPDLCAAATEKVGAGGERCAADRRGSGRWRATRVIIDP